MGEKDTSLCTFLIHNAMTTLPTSDSILRSDFILLMALYHKIMHEILYNKVTGFSIDKHLVLIDSTHGKSL